MTISGSGSMIVLTGTIGFTTGFGSPSMIGEKPPNVWFNANLKPGGGNAGPVGGEPGNEPGAG